MRTVIRWQALGIMLSGVILVLAGLLVAQEATALWGREPLGALMETVGVALLGFGVFGVLVDSKNWQEYFGARLREVVLEQSYLERLGDDTLRSLQTKVMKALFRDPDIDREGSFLNYFNINLHGFITEPYREDVSSTMTVEAVEEDGFRIRDQVLYTCRQAGHTIQPEVRFAPDPDEFIEMNSLRVQVQFPPHHPRKGEWTELYYEPELEESNVDEFAMSCDLDEFGDVDGLTVKMDARYLIRGARMQAWEMAHPTRNFELTLSTPAGYEVHVKPLVLNASQCHIAKHPGLVTLRYDSWMLPSSGVAWQILRTSPSKEPQ